MQIKKTNYSSADRFSPYILKNSKVMAENYRERMIHKAAPFLRN